MDASIIFHTLLLVYGCYFLGRRGLRVAPLPALVLTVTVCCCTAFMVNYGRIEQIQVLSWMPWITATILIAARALESRNIRRIFRDYAVLGTLLGFAFMAGHPQSFLMVGVVAILVFVAATPWRPAGLTIAVGTTLIGFTALAGIAIQGLIHGMSLTAPQNRTQADLVGFSLNLHNLPGALFPHSTSLAPFNESGNFETTGSIGLGALILAILCVLVPTSRRMSRVIASFAVLSIGGLTWAVLPTIPALANLHNVVPLLANERVPGRWLIVAVFALSCLSALGLDGALKRRHWATNPWRLGCFFLLLGIAITVWSLSGHQGTLEIVLAVALSLIFIAIYWKNQPRTPTGKQVLILMIAASALAYPLIIGKTSALSRAGPTFAETTTDDSAISKYVHQFPGPSLSLVPDDFSNYENMLTALRPNAGVYLPSSSPDGYDGGFWVTKRWATFAEDSGILTSPGFVRDLTLGHQLSWSEHTVNVLRRIGTRYVIIPNSYSMFAGTRTVASDNGINLLALRQWPGAAWICRPTRVMTSCADHFLSSAEVIHDRDPNFFVVTLPASNRGERVVLPIQYDPHWKAKTSQGVPVATAVDNGLLLSVDLPQDVRHIEFRYSPPFAKVLITLSMVWIGFLACVSIASLYGFKQRLLTKNDSRY